MTIRNAVRPNRNFFFDCGMSPTIKNFNMLQPLAFLSPIRQVGIKWVNWRAKFLIVKAHWTPSGLSLNARFRFQKVRAYAKMTSKCPVCLDAAKIEFGLSLRSTWGAGLKVARSSSKLKFFTFRRLRKSEISVLVKRCVPYSSSWKSNNLYH